MLRSRRVRPLLNPQLLDPQQVRIEGLAALVHFERDVGVLLGEPLLYPPRVGHTGTLALNQRHQLVRVVQQPAQQQPGAHDGIVGDGHDAVARDPDEVTLVHLARIGHRVARPDA